jgi:hypothetical protein
MEVMRRVAPIDPFIDQATGESAAAGCQTWGMTFVQKGRPPWESGRRSGKCAGVKFFSPQHCIGALDSALATPSDYLNTTFSRLSTPKPNFHCFSSPLKYFRNQNSPPLLQSIPAPFVLQQFEYVRSHEEEHCAL